MSSHANKLKNIAKLSMKEFTRSGLQLIEKPVRQLFTHDNRGNVIKRDDTSHNQKLLAEMALEFSHCRSTGSGVGLQTSLFKNAEGQTLLKTPGCKILFAIQFSGNTVELIGIAVITNLTENVVENKHLKKVENANMSLPTNSLFLELICAKPHTGAATFLLLSLLNKMVKQKDAILCNPTNNKSRTFLEGHGYQNFLPNSGVFKILTRATAANWENKYLEMLRGYEQSMRICTRQGVRDRTQTYWDC
jgi:hypothetical protein